MAKLLLLLVFLLLAWGQEQHQHGDRISVECQQTSIPLYFKVMRQFALGLRTPSNLAQLPGQAIKFTVNNTQMCNLSQSQSICIFNMAKQIDVSCTSKRKAEIDVLQTTMIGENKPVNATFVEMSEELMTLGVLTLKLEGDVLEKVRFGTNTKDIPAEVLLYSKCVRSMMLLDDSIKIAVQVEPRQTCIVGLKGDIEGNWQYKREVTQIDNIDKTFSNFIKEGTVQVFKIPQRSNYTLEILVQTKEQVREGQVLHINFFDTKGNKSQYILNNYEKGLDNFACELFHNKSATKLVLMSNKDIFIKFSLSQSTLQYIPLDEDKYLFTEFNNNSEFLLELDQFYNQKQTHRAVQLITSSEIKGVTYSVFECKVSQDQQFDCQTPIKINETSLEFIPACESLVEMSLCYVKVKANVRQPIIFGILPHLTLKSVEIELDIVHHGTLGQGVISKLFVPGDKLSKVSNDEITVMSHGVSVYLSNNPECRRVLCADYQINQGYRFIPNARKDLFIFLKGTSNVKYYFGIYTKHNNSFALQNGNMMTSIIASDYDSQYFTFEIKDKEKGVQINCNAGHNQLQLFVNVNTSDFPTKDHTQLSSADCYLFIQPSEIKDAKDNKIHIVVKKLPKVKGQVKFGILAVSQGSEIEIPYNYPFFDYFQAKAIKVFSFSIHMPTLASTGLAFKIDVYDKNINGSEVKVKVGNSQKFLYEYLQWDVSTFFINLQRIRQICKPDQKQFCHIKVQVNNTGTLPAELEILMWVRSQPIRVYQGLSNTFDTGGIGDETHLYYEVTDDTPINIYAYSTQVMIQYEVGMRNLMSASPNTIPFPKIIWNERQQNRSPPAYSKFSYINHPTLQHLVKTAKPTDKIYLYMSIRDYEKEKDAKGRNQKLTDQRRGSIQVIFFKHQVEMHEDQRIKFYLREKEPLVITYDLAGILQSNEDQKHEIYLNIVPDSFYGKISMKYYTVQQGIPVTAIEKVPQDSQIVIVDLNKIKQKVKSIGESNDYQLKFELVAEKGRGGSCAASLSTTNSHYRELTLGVPEPFFLRQNSSIVFEFVDFYNEDFKIKINRKQGFPHYKIVSCGAKDSKIDCIQQLTNKTQNEDPKHIIVGGRSHQLEINKQSEEYCKECRYYIGLFSYNEQIMGSLTVLRGGIPVNLVYDQSLTTQVYSNETDTYILTMPIETNSRLLIIPYMGKLKVSIISLSDHSDDSNPAVPEQFNIENQTVEIFFDASNEELLKKLIYVNGVDSDSAMYTILWKSEDSQIMLEDGMPLTLNKEKADITEFTYVPEGDAMLTIMADSKINISIACAESADNTQEKEENKQDHNSQSVIGSDFEGNPIYSEKASKLHLMNLKQKASAMTNISVFSLKQEDCPKYQITITNSNTTEYTILVSGKDIVLMNIGMPMPGTLSRKQQRIYQIVIPEKLQLKIIFRLCIQGDVSVGLTYDKLDLTNRDFEDSFDVSSEQAFHVFKHKAHAGFLYLHVQSLSRDIEYTIQADFFTSQKEANLIHASLDQRKIHAEIITAINMPKTTNQNNSSKNMVQKIIGSGYDYELMFAPLEINAPIKFNVSYYLVESLSRDVLETFSRCKGAFISLKQNSMSQQLLKAEVTNIVVDGRHDISMSPKNFGENHLFLKAKYRSKYPYSFITIIPWTSPVLPGHISYEAYRIIQLSGGSRSPWMLLKQVAANMFYYLQQNTPIRNDMVLGFLVAMIFGTVGISLYVMVCCVVGCIMASAEASAGYYRRSPLATEEHAAGQQQHTENTLDMLEGDKTGVGEDVTQRQIGDERPPEEKDTKLQEKGQPS